MLFNDHSRLTGTHAFLSASKYHWLRYDEEKLTKAFYNAKAAQRGVELHAFAHDAIRLGRWQRDDSDTLNMYVNDAIKLGMTPEQPLVYSENAYGTPDAISFYDDMLRIHDLKNGHVRASEDQLEIYAAFFCLEYGYSPYNIQMELRIYQNEEINSWVPTPEKIEQIMEKIVADDKIIERLRLEEA